MKKRWGYQAFSEPGNWHVGAEADMKRGFSAASCYFSLADARAFARNSGVAHMISTNGLVYCNINSIYHGQSGKKIPIDYDSYLKGQHDAELDAWAQALDAAFPVDAPRPHPGHIITWQHEPSIDNGNQPKTGDSSPAAYVKTYRYVHDRVEKAAGRTFHWGFYPVVANYQPSKKGTKADAYYPGDDIVSVIGADLYSHATGRTYLQKYADLVAFATQHGKPIGIGELGDTKNDAGRPKRLLDLCAEFQKTPSLLHVDWNAKPAYGLGDRSGPTYQAWLSQAPHFD